MPLDLNYHHLYYFWTCVRAGSLTAASRELHLSQSALSLQLMSLEKSFGRRLLNRSRSGVEPTADGRMVFERCERIFPEGESLSAALRSSEKRGPAAFRVGVAGGLGRGIVISVMDRVNSIPRLVPSVRVAPGESILQDLLRHRLDVGFFSSDVTAQTGPSYRVLRLGAVPLRFVAAPGLAAKLGSARRRGREYPMLLRPEDHPVRRQVDAWLTRTGSRAFSVVETADVDLMRSLALQGRGVAVVSAALVKGDLESGRLVTLTGSPLGLLHEIWAAAPLRPHADVEIREAIVAAFALGPSFERAAA